MAIVDTPEESRERPCRHETRSRKSHLLSERGKAPHGKAARTGSTHPPRIDSAASLPCDGATQTTASGTGGHADWLRHIIYPQGCTTPPPLPSAAPVLQDRLNDAPSSFDVCASAHVLPDIARRLGPRPIARLTFPAGKIGVLASAPGKGLSASSERARATDLASRQSLNRTVTRNSSHLNNKQVRRPAY